VTRAAVATVANYRQLMLQQTVRDTSEESDREQSDELKAALQLIPDDKRYTGNSFLNSRQGSPGC
jgi:hypothetical protein